LLRFSAWSCVVISVFGNRTTGILTDAAWRWVSNEWSILLRNLGLRPSISLLRYSPVAYSCCWYNVGVTDSQIESVAGRNSLVTESGMHQTRCHIAHFAISGERSSCANCCSVVTSPSVHPSVTLLTLLTVSLLYDSMGQIIKSLSYVCLSVCLSPGRCCEDVVQCIYASSLKNGLYRSSQLVARTFAKTLWHHFVS